MGGIAVRRATAQDAGIVSSILREAAEWLERRGAPLWKTDELSPDRIAEAVRDGQFWIAWAGEVAAGCVKFQTDDPLFWPDVPAGESAFIHRLAVRRAFAGGGVSSALIAWAKAEAGRRGLRFLRLDTVSDRPKLRRVYESRGFRLHSERQVGPYHVARYECRVTGT